LVASHSAPQAHVRRARLALVLAEDLALSYKEVGALCDLDDETVYKWRRRWASHGRSLADATGRDQEAAPFQRTCSKLGRLWGIVLAQL